MRVLNTGNIFGFSAARKGGKAIIEVDPSLDDQFLEATFFSGRNDGSGRSTNSVSGEVCYFFETHPFFCCFQFERSFFQVGDET